MSETSLTTSAPKPATGAPCRKIGLFIAKGGCFALQDSAGDDFWLEINPVPLHLLDERVEVTGRRFGADHIFVEAVGPASRS